MKKFFYSMLLMAVALFSASAFVSCGSDDDDPVAPVPQVESKKFVKYLLMLPEDYFSFGDVIVTIEADGKKTVKKMSETPKVDNPDWDLWTSSVAESMKAARILSLPEVQFISNPVRVTTEFLPTDAGKQKMANAKDDEETDFALYLECSEYVRWSDGVIADYGYPGPAPTKVEFLKKGVNIKEYWNHHINIMKDGYKANFDRTFKDL